MLQIHILVTYFDGHTGVLTLRAKYLPRGCFCKFETKVWYATENKDFFHVITSCSRSLPPPPEDEKQECGFDTLSMDELFKVNMPDWLPDDYATSKLQYYEYMFEQSNPFELGKVIVQIRGVVGSMEKVTVDNAVFYISFKTGCGVVCKGVIRRTRDGMPEHLSLEAKWLEGCRSPSLFS
ncbi:BnaC02g23990D [Brassica napus]|uniref:BnaC02g23990D protein n=1 Tax=Brassica napus TaxID=3708 RepID=A0A078G638_BRANA|nr:BnaC02g23990D [Brassica napus]